MRNQKQFILGVALFSSSLLQAAAGSTTINGNYIVPVPTELAAWASFPTTYTQSTDAAGKATLSYQLPEDVVGPTSPEIILTQTGPIQGGLIPFRGPNGSGSCRQTSQGTTCFVIYPSFDTTIEQIQSFLRTKYPADDDAKHELRTRVARFFNADPKGIVNFNPARKSTGGVAE